MKKIICAIIMLSFATLTYPTVKDDFFKDLLKDFNGVIAKFNTDYSKSAGVSSGGGVFRGSASCGNFPSFNAGSTFNVLFFDRPMDFLKEINFIGTDWDKISDSLNSTPVKWFDENFLPLPLTANYFEVGLPKGFYAGGHFNILPIGLIYNRAVSDSTFFELKDFTLWGIGFETGYTILDDKNSYLPNVAIGIGFDYSEVNLDLRNVGIGGIDIDDDNKNIPASLSFSLKNKIPSVSTNLAISKKFIFFEPFADFRFSQSFYYNETEIGLCLDTEEMEATTRATFGDGKFTISNKDVDGKGVLIPVTDFTVSTGFHFDIFGFRLGSGVSWGCATGKGMVSFDVGAQIEDNIFKKVKSRGGDK